MAYTMTAEERAAFLADVHVGVLAFIGSTGAPIAAPLWYSYEPGGDVRMLVGAKSQKATALRSSPRASLCAQSEDAPYRYVSVEGPVVVSDDYDPAELRALAVRYLGEELGAMWMAAYEDADAPTVTVTLTPDRWYSADYGKPG